MDLLSKIYLTYARLFDFPTRQVGKGAKDGSIGRSMARMHSQAGIPSPPPMRTTLKPARLEQIYISTFEVGIPGPPVALYETAYCSPGPLRLHALEEILRFYEFFDLKLAGERREMPDHLTVELEFMGAMAHMERVAGKQGAPEDAFCLAQRDFLARHLLPTLHSLKAQAIPEPFYKEVLEGLLTFVRAQSEDLPQDRLCACKAVSPAHLTN